MTIIGKNNDINLLESLKYRYLVINACDGIEISIVIHAFIDNIDFIYLVTTN